MKKRKDMAQTAAQSKARASKCAKARKSVERQGVPLQVNIEVLAEIES